MGVRSALLLLTTFCAISLSSETLAVPVLTASADALLNGMPSSDSDTSATMASAAVVGAEHTGRGAADSSGRLGVSADFFGASGTFATIDAGATWTDTFDYVSGPATFGFFIPGAAIGFEANNVPNLVGSFQVDIFLNGTNIFTAGAQVTTLMGTPQLQGDLLLVQTGTLLSPVFATDIAGVGGAGYRFNSFSDSLVLSPIIGTNTIFYSMQASVSGLIGETSAVASIGDPLNLSLQPAGVVLTVDPGVVPVPEPGTLTLLVAGLIGMGLAKRRATPERLSCLNACQRARVPARHRQG